MNILLINHYAGSDKYGMDYRPFYLSKEWVKLGHKVTIAAASFSHLRTKAPCIHGSVTEENIDGIRYVWLKTPGYSGNGVRRVVNMLAFVAQLLRYRSRLGGNCPPDIVIASSTYPLDIFPAYRIARKYRAKLVFEVHDLWPLSLIEVGGISRWHPLIVLLQRAENFACRKADRIVATLPKASTHFQQHGMADHKFAFVPNGIDVTEWQTNNQPTPEQHANALEMLRAEGRFLVGYVGAHGVANALDYLIEAANRLQTQPVTFVLVGQGPEKDGLQQKARRLGVNNVVFLPPVPKACIPKLLDFMDALYLGWNNKPIYRFGISPTKLIDYMMASKPIIHSVEAGNDPVAESGCGASCPPEDPQAIADAVAHLMAQTPAEQTAMGQKGRDYAVHHHDYAVLARRFFEAMG